jgi:hypothetical protein
VDHAREQLEWLVREPLQWLPELSVAACGVVACIRGQAPRPLQLWRRARLRARHVAAGGQSLRMSASFLDCSMASPLRRGLAVGSGRHRHVRPTRRREDMARSAHASPQAHRGRS